MISWLEFFFFFFGSAPAALEWDWRTYEKLSTISFTYRQTVVTAFLGREKKASKFCSPHDI